MSQIADEFQVLSRRQNVINRRELPRQADVLAYLIGIFVHIETAHDGVTAVGLNERCQDIDDRRFTRAVATQKRKDRSIFHGEVDSGEDSVLLVRLFQLTY